MARARGEVPKGGDGQPSEAAERSEREALADVAIECDCLDGLKKGPCGVEFKEAFLCFLKSGHPEKGTDCIEPYFTALKICINQNEQALLDLVPEDDPARYTGDALPAIDAKGVRLPGFYERVNWKPGDPEPLTKDRDRDEDEDMEEAD